MTHGPVQAGQIDLVDGSGVVRASLIAADDLDGHRSAPATGLVIRDRTGKERGGIAVLDHVSGSRVVNALDHRGGDAIGMVVDDDGTAAFFINDAPGPDRAPRATRLSISTSVEGTPTIALQDHAGRPRLVLTLTADGAGAIRFLDARGDLVREIIPEHAPL